MKIQNMPTQTITPSSPLPVVLIDGPMWVRRFTHQLGVFVPEILLSSIQQDVMNLRRHVETMSKLGYEAKVVPPEFNKPVTLDLALLAISDRASEMFAAAGQEQDSISIKMRTVAVKMHKTVQRLRRALKTGSAEGPKPHTHNIFRTSTATKGEV